MLIQLAPDLVVHHNEIHRATYVNESVAIELRGNMGTRHIPDRNKDLWRVIEKAARRDAGL